MFHNLKVLQTIEVAASKSRALRTVRSGRGSRNSKQSTTQHNYEQFVSTDPLSVEQPLPSIQNEFVSSETILHTPKNSIHQNTSLQVKKLETSTLTNLDSFEKTLVTKHTQHEKLADSVTPLWKLRYSVQLKLKQERATEVLIALKKNLQSRGINNFPTQQLTTPCPLQDILPSPVIREYRNKDEFVVQRGVDGEPKTVGFLTGHPLDPLTVCVPPTHLLNIKPRHKSACHHFEEFIRTNKHPACLHFRDAPGVWRAITVRSTRAGQLMLIVTIHPHTLTEEDLEELKSELKSYFSKGSGAELGVTSLYLQACPHTRCRREQAPFELLLGLPYITESCSGLSFQLSPDTFFQVNLEAAELLYGAIRETAELSSFSTLLDLCCGTGALSLPLAGSVRGVVGVEEVTAAVDDARNNAVHNGITNATFVPGAVQHVLPLLTPELQDCSDVVVVLNPGRGGLNNGVIMSLRENPAISKVLYVSCNPQGRALENFVHLGSVKEKHLRKFPPMLPRYAFSVDMFPLTNHFEMGILFTKSA